MKKSDVVQLNTSSTASSPSLKNPQSVNRSRLARRNIVASFLIKGLNIIVSLAVVPMTITYLDPTRYGIWITISSIIAWFGFFDIGLTNGLRNMLAEAIAESDDKKGKIYVSTTYAILSIVVLFILVLFFALNSLVNWNTLLNIDSSIVSGPELKIVAIIVFTFFSLQLILKVINTVFIAHQRPAMASVFDCLARVLSLVVIYILTKTTEGNLTILGFTFSGIPVFILLAATLWYFKNDFRYIVPSIKYVDFSKARSLFGLGVKFFVIQIAAILLYQTDNIIISRMFGANQVTEYNICFKYFSVLMMVFSILVTPFWSAFTEAWMKKDITWIRNIVRKLALSWLFLFFVGLLMLCLSKHVYSIWLGNQVLVPFFLSLFVFIWVMVNTWNSIFSQFLNGVGKLRIQLILGISAAIINIPLSIFLGKLMGIHGVILGNILVLIVPLIIYPIQYYKLINGTAKGIWKS